MVKGPSVYSLNATHFRDAIVQCYIGKLKLHECHKKYHIHSRKVRLAIEEIQAINNVRLASQQLQLQENSDRKQVYRWATKYTGAKVIDSKSYTIYELCQLFKEVLNGETTLRDAMEEYGIPKSSYYRYLKEILDFLKISTAKQVKNNIKEGGLSLRKLTQCLATIKIKPKGYATKLLPDEEVLVVATAEMKNLASQPQRTKRVAASLNTLIQQLNHSNQCKKRMRYDIQPQSKMKYARRVIRRVNSREPNAVNQIKNSKHGEVKVAGLSNQRAKQCDPRLAWYMFHAICNLYRHVKKLTDTYYDNMLVSTGHKDVIDERILGPKEVRDVDILPDSPVHESSTAIVPVTKFKYRLDISQEAVSKSIDELLVVPKDLDVIQPRADQVWNVDEIGIDPNGKWTRIVCTYKWCNIAKVWKTQEGEHAPFWVTLCFFTRADGQVFIPPTIVHKSVEWTKDLSLNIPDNWVVHSTPSGYMDRDGWLKTTENFSSLAGASAGNPQFPFFDGHDSHWDSDSLDLYTKRNCHPFFLKAGDSTNDQPNDNGPNASFKACYNDVKDEWDERFGTTQYTPAHMNKVLVKAWNEFTLKAAPIVVKAFKKTKLYPLQPPARENDMLIASLACTAAMQCSVGKKSLQLNELANKSINPVTFKTTTTSDTLTIMTAKGDTSRNMMVRSVAYDFMRTSLLIPAQEMKKIVQEHTTAKGIKVGSLAIPLEDRRQNPDTSRGLWVNAAVLAQARAVQSAKQKKKKIDEIKKKNQLLKNGVQVTNRLQAYERIMGALKNNSSVSKSDMLLKQSTTDLKLTYQHLGGLLSKLPNGQRSTYVALLLNQREIEEVSCNKPPVHNLMLPMAKKKAIAEVPLVTLLLNTPPVHDLMLPMVKNDVGCVKMV